MKKIFYPIVCLAIPSLFSTIAVATPLDFTSITPEENQSIFWPVPGENAVAILPEADFVIHSRIPELSDREKKLPGAWRGILTTDLLGTIDGQSGTVELSLIDPSNDEIIATTTHTTLGQAPKAAVTIISSSAQPGAGAAKAFDGNEKSIWHTNYEGGPKQPPHWIGLIFGQPRELSTLTYLARTDGGLNGSAKDFRLEVMPENSTQWKTVTNGQIERKKAKDPLVIKLDQPVNIDAFRFVIESDHSGQGFGNAAQIIVPDLEFKDEEPILAEHRAYLEIPSDRLDSLTGKDLALKITHQVGSAVILAQPRLARLHTKPSGKLFGRSNGGLGPDKLDAALFGFTALIEHQQDMMSIMQVRDNSPAAAAGLLPGDAIIAVEDLPLARNNVAPGWDWFHNSHEARIGRATEAAIKAGKSHLTITVLRDNNEEVLRLPIGRKVAFTSLIPGDDPEADRMLDDLLDYVVRNQLEEGNWSGKPIVTTFAALALMATGDEKYLPNVLRTVEWAMASFPEPEKYGNLGFWNAGYVGKLYAEWYLATGDRRVLPYLKDIQNWAHRGSHTSRWDVPALGHGTNGLPYGEKALVAPACHLLIAEALMKRANQRSKIWELLTPYMKLSWSDPSKGGNGTLGYNPSLHDLNEFWARSGMFAMVCHLRKDRYDMRDGMVKIMRERHPWLRNSHAYGEPGGALGLLGLNLASPTVYREVVAEYAWWFSLAWEPGYGLRFTTPHMGAPYMGEDDLITSAYALVLQGPKQKIHLTGANNKNYWREALRAHLKTL